MGIKGVHLAAFAATVACLWALAMPAVAAQPGMTVKIPARQDVDRVYILAAIHQSTAPCWSTGRCWDTGSRGSARAASRSI